MCNRRTYKHKCKCPISWRLCYISSFEHLVSNKTGASADVDVFLVTNTGDDVFLLRNAPIPAGSSLELISGSKVIMESSDVLRIRTDTASAIDVAVSYLEQT